MVTYIRYCYADEVIHSEIDNLHDKLKDCLSKKAYTESTFETLIYILERLIFIEDYYKEMENENKSSIKREYPHFRRDSNNNIQEITGTELKSTYANEIANNKKFMKYLNDESRKHINEIINWVHKSLNLKSNDIWAGIKINSTEFFWRSKKSSIDNKKDCVRYFVNMIKHCYGISIITETNINAIVYIRTDILDIAKITLKAIDDFYEK